MVVLSKRRVVQIKCHIDEMFFDQTFVLLRHLFKSHFVDTTFHQIRRLDDMTFKRYFVDFSSNLLISANFCRKYYADSWLLVVLNFFVLYTKVKELIDLGPLVTNLQPDFIPPKEEQLIDLVPFLTNPVASYCLSWGMLDMQTLSYWVIICHFYSSFTLTIFIRPI